MRTFSSSESEATIALSTSCFGFAAAFAKVGAVMTAFLFPVLLADIGTDLLLVMLIGTSLLGAFITWQFRIETAGVSLETVPVVTGKG